MFSLVLPNKTSPAPRPKKVCVIKATMLEFPTFVGLSPSAQAQNAYLFMMSLTVGFFFFCLCALLIMNPSGFWTTAPACKRLICFGIHPVVFILVQLQHVTRTHGINRPIAEQCVLTGICDQVVRLSAYQ